MFGLGISDRPGALAEAASLLAQGSSSIEQGINVGFSMYNQKKTSMSVRSWMYSMSMCGV